MIVINEDKSIYMTRGDTVAIDFTAQLDGENYIFRAGDVVRITVCEKKECSSIVLKKDFKVEEENDIVKILLASDDTKFGEVISKPKDYWYEIELNPETQPQTLIGYDEDGAKVLRLYPEGSIV